MSPFVLVVAPTDPLLWFSGFSRSLSTRDMEFIFACLGLDRLGLLQHYRGKFVKSSAFYGTRLKIKIVMEGARGRRMPNAD